MKIMVTSIKRSHACTATVCPNPAAGHHRPTPSPETPGHPQASLGQTPVGSLFLSPGSWCTRFCCALQESTFQPCVSSGSSIVGLMATSSKRAYAIPTRTASVPVAEHSRPTGDAQTQFCLSLCGVPGSWCAQSLFEPSEHLWREWGLILNVNSPLLPSCWDSL